MGLSLKDAIFGGVQLLGGTAAIAATGGAAAPLVGAGLAATAAQDVQKAQQPDKPPAAAAPPPPPPPPEQPPPTMAPPSLAIPPPMTTSDARAKKEVYAEGRKHGEMEATARWARYAPDVPHTDVGPMGKAPGRESLTPQSEGGPGPAFHGGAPMHVQGTPPPRALTPDQYPFPGGHAPHPPPGIPLSQQPLNMGGVQQADMVPDTRPGVSHGPLPTPVVYGFPGSGPATSAQPMAGANPFATPEQQALAQTTTGSDKREKDSVDEEWDPRNASPAKMLDALKPVSYNYKEGSGEDTSRRKYGIMAQDLEKTPMGASAVVHRPDGMRAIDHGGGISIALGGLANLNQRLRALEGNAPEKQERSVEDFMSQVSRHA